MVLSGMLPGLIIDWKDAKKADSKFGHAAFVKKMDIIWIGVMPFSETHLFRLEHIPFYMYGPIIEVVHNNTNMLT